MSVDASKAIVRRKSMSVDIFGNVCVEELMPDCCSQRTESRRTLESSDGREHEKERTEKPTKGNGAYISQEYSA